MTKLTDTQLVVLSSACRSDDGMAVRPEALKPAGAAKLAASLIAKGFLREIRAKVGAPVWREDESGRYALKILKAGREAIGVEDEAPDAAEDTSVPEHRPARQSRKDVVRGEEANEANAGGVKASTSVRPASKHLSDKPAAQEAATIKAPAPASSKRVLVTSLLERPQGAVMTDLIAATGWLPHTTRAFLSGLRKRGLNISRSKEGGNSASVYRIVAAGSVAVAA